MTTRTLNTRHYLSGELYGIETAHRRGYVSARQYDDDLAMDWYGICCEEGMPFVQCVRQRKYCLVDYDLQPFIDAHPGLTGLTDIAIGRIRREASAQCKLSPSHMARHQVAARQGIVKSLPQHQAHVFARWLAHQLRDLSNYHGGAGT